MALPKKDRDELIEGVHEGDTSLFNLPESVFLFNFFELMESVEDGFGGGIGSFPENSPKANRAVDYRDNIFRFSGAKLFTEVKELSLSVFDSQGQKRPFKQFREIGLEINRKYNVTFLKTEQNTAFGMSQSADAWLDIEDEKDDLPLLQYKTVGDARVRDEHRAWDGIIRPVDDKFWDTRAPINSWRCRCRLIQLGKGKITDLTGKPKNSDTVFNINPGKVKFIFDEKAHPYFSVEPRFKKRLKDNFGFKKPA